MSRVSVYELFDKYGIDNFEIILIESVKANSKDELRKREGYYIKQIKCVNKVVAGRSLSEWRLENMDRVREKQKTYETLDKAKEYRRQYKIANSNIIECPCSSSIIKYNMYEHIKSKKHLSYLEMSNQQLTNN